MPPGLPVSVAPVLEKRNAGDFLLLRRTQHVQFDHRRALGIDLGNHLHRIAADTFEHHLLVRRQFCRADMFMIGAQRFNVSGRLNAQLVIRRQRQAPRQRHNLIPPVGRLCRVHIENHNKPTHPVGRGGRRMHARRRCRAKIELTARGRHKLVPIFRIVAQQILPAAHMAEKRKHVPVANRPEIGTRAVVSHHREPVVFDERMQIRPIGEVLRTQQEIRPNPLAAGARQRTARKRVIHPVFFPDARVKHPVGRNRSIGVHHRNHGLARHLFPVQQQRIAGHRNHIAHLRPVIHRNHAVFLHKRGAGKALLFRIGINGIGQIPPVNQILAHGMPPVLAWILRRIPLIEKVPASLPETKPVRIVQRVLRIDIMVNRPVRIAGHLLPRRGKPLHQRILPQLRFLRVQRIGKAELGHARCIIGMRILCHGSLLRMRSKGSFRKKR